MGIGLGVVLIVLGLVFGLGVVEIPGLDEYVATETLGWILFGAGVLAIILALVMNKQRSQTRHVVEERRDVV